MSREKLRGATRRDFVRGAFALGAAMGWGPTRIMEFLDRGGGLAHGIGEKAMNLLVITGVDGSGGHYNQIIPHPDQFAGTDATSATGDRYADRMPMHFIQGAAGGGTATNMNGAFLGRFHDYASPASGLKEIADAGGGLGKWNAGERFKRLKGAANMGFRGIQSTNSGSAAIDKKLFGAEKVPSNTQVTPGDNFIVYARETPFQKYGLKKAFSNYEGGRIQVHSAGSENHWVNRANKWSVQAAAAIIQQEVRPAVLQAMICGNMSGGTNFSDSASYYGSLPGAPSPALVGNAAAMVNLFASNAVRAGGALTVQKNAALYEAFYKGLLGTQKSAVLPTYFRANQTTKLASNLIGVDLASKLAPTDADKRRYGFTGSAPATVAEFRDRLIVAEKAMKLGLSTNITLGMLSEDIHGVFSAAGTGAINAAQGAAIYGGFLDAFMEGLMVDEEGKRVPDPFHPELTLGDNTVIVIVQDNLRNQFEKGGWPDDSGSSSPINQNRAKIMGNGFLQIGSFGGERPLSAGGASEVGFYDAVTGDFLTPAQATTKYNSFTAGNQANMIEMYGNMGMAAALYAVARGNLRRVNDFYSGPDFPVLRVPQLL